MREAGPKIETGGEGREPGASNRFNRMEWAGAFGDLGTLVPFVVAYVAVVKVDPFGILLTFGAAMVACGLYYRTPFPVQPMKAIGAVAATQAAQTATITAATVYAASLTTGIVWLVLGLTGLAKHLARLAPRFVVVGIVLGLGIGFMVEGTKLMNGGWLIAAIGLLGTLLLLTNRVVPAMFLLLAFGIVCGAVERPESCRLCHRQGRRYTGRISRLDPSPGMIFSSDPHFSPATVTTHAR